MRESAEAERTPGDPATEWQRSNPDIVVYLPKGGALNDTDNEHFLVFEAPKSDELLAMWTQSSCEGRGDNDLLPARSAEGEHSRRIRLGGSSDHLAAGRRRRP